jgi:hypothetical protein
MKRIIPGSYILCIILFMSCTKAAKLVPSEPEPELFPIDAVMQKVKQDSPEIEKYFLLDETGKLIVKADLKEIRQETGKVEHFQVWYDLRQIEDESGPVTFQG